MNKTNKINTVLIISGAIATLANIALVCAKPMLYGAVWQEMNIWHFAAFFAGFNLHFACFLMRHWLKIAIFGAFRAWFLAGYLVMFPAYLALILIGNDIICLYVRVIWSKPQIKPPGC